LLIFKFANLLIFPRPSCYDLLWRFSCSSCQFDILDWLY